MRFVTAYFSLFFLFAGQVLANDSTDAIARAATSSDAAIAQPAIQMLRDIGPSGLDALLNKYDQSPDEKLIPAIDAVAAQKNAITSRLYWYTDLEKAKTAAQSSGKPIIYLRLLGKLTDEYSCANSRYFRTILYANAGISRMLREQFILVWGSVRPGPVMTIDYGDGLSLRRTITGNSVHYILDSDGNVCDALPGIYAPQTFFSVVASWQFPAGFDSRAHRTAQREDDLLRGWRRVLAKANPQLLASLKEDPITKADAANAGFRAVSKLRVEMPMLRQIAPQFAAELDQAAQSTAATKWNQIGDLYINFATLDSASINVIRNENPSRYADPDALNRTVVQFEHSIAQDTARNEFLFRRQILSWLREANGNIRLPDLNRQIYSELFLTPRTDPWLGMMPADTYTALPNDGVIDSPVTAMR